MLSRSVLLMAALLLVACAAEQRHRDRPSKKTMKNLCEMPEFQQAMAADEELEPAAVVYEVMTKRLEKMESHIQELQKKLEEAPTQQDIEAVAAALKLELMDHVDDKVSLMQTEIEANVQDILRNLMVNLASLGHEYGFELDSTTIPTTTTKPPYKDCSDLGRAGEETGVHVLRINGDDLEGFCEMKEDNTVWLVIQRRTGDDIDFWRGWDDYKKGFGDLMGSFYLGNEKIHQVTNAKEHMLRVEMTDALGDVGYAEFSNFSVSSEGDGYRLHYDDFIGGTAGDSLIKSNGQQFSTHDRDRDGSRLYSCSRLHHGAFWYDRCGSANLNGVYLGQRPPRSTFNWQNIFWYSWKRDLRALSSVQMMIRPRIIRKVIAS